MLHALAVGVLWQRAAGRERLGLACGAVISSTVSPVYASDVSALLQSSCTRKRSAILRPETADGEYPEYEYLTLHTVAHNPCFVFYLCFVSEKTGTFRMTHYAGPHLCISSSRDALPGHGIHNQIFTPLRCGGGGVE